MPRLLKKVSFPVAIVLLTGMLFLFAGCTVKSGPKNLAAVIPLQTAPAPDASLDLAKAFATTDRDGKKFWFSGWEVSKIQRRNTGFYYNGTYDKEKGYILDATILGQPFRYYRWGNDVYVSEEDKWRQVESTRTSMEPFTAFAKLQFLTDKAIKLPDEEVLSKKCNVYRLTLDYSDAVKVAKSMGLSLTDDKKAIVNDYFKQMTMTFTIWAGKNDSFIYQYKTITTMPVPGAGSLYEEVYTKFWDYNSASITVPGPEKIEKYLIKD